MLIQFSNDNDQSQPLLAFLYTSCIVWQGLHTGKKNYTLIQLCLVQPSLVADFRRVCTHFEERPAVHLTTCM